MNSLESNREHFTVVFAVMDGAPSSTWNPAREERPGQAGPRCPCPRIQRIARTGSIPRFLPMPHLLLCPLTAKPFEGLSHRCRTPGTISMRCFNLMAPHGDVSARVPFTPLRKSAREAPAHGALEAERHAPHRTIAWQFTRPHAREKLAYLSPLAHTHLTEHSAFRVGPGPGIPDNEHRTRNFYR